MHLTRAKPNLCGVRPRVGPQHLVVQLLRGVVLHFPVRLPIGGVVVCSYRGPESGPILFALRKAQYQVMVARNPSSSV